MPDNIQAVLADSACLICAGETTFEAVTLELWDQIAGNITARYEADDTGTLITTDAGDKIILNL